MFLQIYAVYSMSETYTQTQLARLERCGARSMHILSLALHYSYLRVELPASRCLSNAVVVASTYSSGVKSGKSTSVLFSKISVKSYLFITPAGRSF